MTGADYTVSLANAALPLVRAITKDLVALEARLRESTLAYRELKDASEPDQDALNSARSDLSGLAEQRDACVTELQDLGVRLGDARRGVCDFPSNLDGETVYLCWELGEESVVHFHGTDEGYDRRRPLPVAVPLA